MRVVFLLFLFSFVSVVTIECQSTQTPTAHLLQRTLTSTSSLLPPDSPTKALTASRTLFVSGNGSTTTTGSPTTMAPAGTASPVLTPSPTPAGTTPIPAATTAQPPSSPPPPPPATTSSPPTTLAPPAATTSSSFRFNHNRNSFLTRSSVLENQPGYVGMKLVTLYLNLSLLHVASGSISVSTVNGLITLDDATIQSIFDPAAVGGGPMVSLCDLSPIPPTMGDATCSSLNLGGSGTPVRDYASKFPSALLSAGDLSVFALKPQTCPSPSTSLYDCSFTFVAASSCAATSNTLGFGCEPKSNRSGPGLVDSFLALVLWIVVSLIVFIVIGVLLLVAVIAFNKYMESKETPEDRAIRESVERERDLEREQQQADEETDRRRAGLDADVQRAENEAFSHGGLSGATDEQRLRVDDAHQQRRECW